MSVTANKRSLMLLAVGAAMVALVVVGSFLNARPPGPELPIGSYARYTGRTLAGTPASTNESVRIEVVDISNGEEQWLQRSNVYGQITQNSYWMRPGITPFHAGFKFLKSYNTTRMIGGTGYEVTAQVFSLNSSTNTYYYSARSSFLPIEFTTNSSSRSEDLFLTSTNIPGTDVVQAP